METGPGSPREFSSRSHFNPNRMDGAPTGLDTSATPLNPSSQSTHLETTQATSRTAGVQVVANALQEMSIINGSWRDHPSAHHIDTHPASPRSSSSQTITLEMKPRSARAKKDAKVQPSAASGGIPDPTSRYLSISNSAPQSLQEPQHLLVVIDLNGTLLFRASKKQPTKFTARPHTRQFLKYCIETFTVVIWSSARPGNVEKMCDAILTPDLRRKVVAIWGRDKFGLSSQDYNLKVQCYKRLTTLWSNNHIARSHPLWASGGQWDQTNTVLVDDSLEKGRSEPFNLVEIPEFFGDEKEEGEILPQVHDFLNHLSLHANVSACLRAQAFKALLPPQAHPASNEQSGIRVNNA